MMVVTVSSKIKSSYHTWCQIICSFQPVASAYLCAGVSQDKDHLLYIVNYLDIFHKKGTESTKKHIETSLSDEVY